MQNAGWRTWPEHRVHHFQESHKPLWAKMVYSSQSLLRCGPAAGAPRGARPEAKRSRSDQDQEDEEGGEAAALQGAARTPRGRWGCAERGGSPQEASRTLPRGEVSQTHG
ncbi:unnamed protein product [Prorocentrum cordatum]|uniref:Uncharacterized protein n=1 Tax=Prorocentrum cordatum TaxID=2364126 RepID=A0ABN9VUN3_9DINO|nr:unnamed protein product [Polarella glacialis]